MSLSTCFQWYLWIFRELQAIIHDYFIAYHNIAKDTKCRFKFVGESIKDGGSGLAVQKGSKLANQISALILKYQDQEFFLQLQRKWMENKCVETSTKTSSATSNNNVVDRIGKEYFGGVFIALCGATLISIGILVAEYLLNRKIHTRTYWVSERRRKRWRRYWYFFWKIWLESILYICKFWSFWSFSWLILTSV